MANAGTGGCGLGADHGVDAGTGSRRSRSRSRGAKRGFGTGFVSELPEFFGVEEVQCGALGDEVRPDIDTWVRRPVVEACCPYLAWYQSEHAMARCLANSSSVENCGFSFIGDIRHSATVSEKTEDKASDWLFLLDL